MSQSVVDVVSQFDKRKAPTWMVADALEEEGHSGNAVLMRDFGCYVKRGDFYLNRSVVSWLEKSNSPFVTFYPEEPYWGFRGVRGIANRRFYTLISSRDINAEDAVKIWLITVLNRWTCWRCQLRSVPQPRTNRASTNHVHPMCETCFSERVSYPVGRACVRA